jgi:hypothetical protein
LRVDYPWWWKLVKPSWTEIQIHFQNGSLRRVHVQLPPNAWHELWIAAQPEANLGNYFAADPAEWRQKASQPLQSVSIVFGRADWLSVYPRAVEVKAVESVKPLLAP